MLTDRSLSTLVRRRSEYEEARSERRGLIYVTLSCTLAGLFLDQLSHGRISHISVLVLLLMGCAFGFRSHIATKRERLAAIDIRHGTMRALDADNVHEEEKDWARREAVDVWPALPSTHLITAIYIVNSAVAISAIEKFL